MSRKSIKKGNTMLKWIEIDLGIITENVRIIRQSLKPGVKFIAVVKSNGYGHGALEASKAALRGGADMLAVLTAEEGVSLRTALDNYSSEFKDVRIMLLAPSLPEEAAAITRNNLIPCSDSSDFIAVLDNAAKSPYPCNIEIDMGMGRWGISKENLVPFIDSIKKYRNVHITGISTHIGYKPPENMTDAEEKLRTFAAMQKAVSSSLGRKIEAYAANSTVFCDISDSQFDGIRIGNLMYGIYPTDIYRKRRQGPPLPGLRRPWQMYAKIISIKEIRKGQKLGYNSEFTAPRDMKIASIPAGYGDGLTMEPMEYKIRISSGFRYWGMIGGKKAYFICRPGISHILLDITDIPEARIGTNVALHVRRTSANILIPRIYANN